MGGIMANKSFVQKENFKQNKITNEKKMKN